MTGAKPVSGIRRAASRTADLTRAPEAAPNPPSGGISQPPPRPPKPVRVRFTLDLVVSDHQALQDFAHGADVRAASVMRALLARLTSDPVLADEIRQQIWRAEGRQQ